MLETRSAAQDRATGDGWRGAARTAPRRRPLTAPVVLVGLGAVLVVVALAAGRAGSELLLDAGAVLLTVGGVGLLLDAGLARWRGAGPVEAQPPPVLVPSAPRDDRLGLVGVREELDAVDVLRGVLPGQELWWMDTFPLTLAGDLDAIHKALGAGVRVRLLVLDPKSPALASRLREIRHHYGLSPMDLRRSFDTLVHQLRALGELDPVVAERLEVRVHDGPPGAPIYLVLGDPAAAEEPAADPRPPEVVRAFSSYFLLDASQDMPYLEWRDGPFADRLHAYARHKWAEGRTVFPTEPPERSASAFNVRPGPAPRTPGRGAAGS
ncbi:hypothetical protein [uncultured Kocuria sp.]|uniref:hypothetical protein n=1 Tax=uncultured Kocuria sp. TaxID=259305 RepID=UPI002638020F|nr:hypothetical protein [uncultured Kocuria sp.]